MLTWYAGSLASQIWLLKPFTAHTMARDLVLFGWMMWPAPEVSHTSTIAGTVDGENMIALTAGMPVFSALMVPLAFVCRVVVRTMVELKFIAVVNGAQCVMITGILMMPTWCVVSWVFPAHPPLLAVHVTARDLAQSGWMRSAKEESLRYCPVLILAGV